MTARTVRVLNDGRGLDPAILRMLVDQERAGIIRIVNVPAPIEPDPEQPTLFAVAAAEALAAATASTERAHALRGAARSTVERKAADHYSAAGYWSGWARTGQVA
ncbi:MAG: hypothetical protein AB7O95_13815 [Geminicoccaceae bacterium]